MPPPIRPSPIIPNCIVSSLSESLFDGGIERSEASRHIGAEVHAKGAALPLRQDFEIAPRLGGFDDAEGVL